MYLKRISLLGFKSFSHKTTLEFPPPKQQLNSKGITAIIGPNGSGKSNIADAIRWVLGEQSLKLLRGKKSEDVIFSGSQKSARLNRAEVTLTIDNTEKQADIDYAELTITRRVYRNGESEYLLNGAPSKLSDITLLLAKANVGQKNYAVIGQGMIDSILNASPTERKDFFDEATGVKQYQIKRDAADRKLERTKTHLHETEMLLAELTPHLKLLARQAKKWEKREEIEKKLKDLHVSYYNGMWNHLNRGLTSKNSLAKTQSDSILKARKKLESEQVHFEKLAQKQSSSIDYAELQKRSQRTLALIREADADAARIQHQIENHFELQGEGDIAWVHRRLHEIIEESQELHISQKKVHAHKERLSTHANETTKEKKQLEQSIVELKSKIIALESKSITATQEELYSEIQNLQKTCEQTLLVFQKNDNKNIFIKHIKNIQEKVSSLVSQSKPSTEWKKDLTSLRENLDSFFLQKEEVMLTLQECGLEQKMLEQQENIITQQLDKLRKEETQLQQKLSLQKKSSVQAKSKELALQLDNLQKEKKKHQAEFENTQEQLDSFHHTQNSHKNQMVTSQKLITRLSNTLRDQETECNNLGIECARLEQRLEDLKAEIQQETQQAIRKEIQKPSQPSQSIAQLESMVPHIHTLKRQIIQIGEIEESVLEEYKETKERSDFLTHQAGDLKRSHSHLLKIISELDNKIEKQFAIKFKTINNHFKKYFATLFPGGKAQLLYKKVTFEKELEEEETEESPHKQTQTFIEIQAAPPNKKIASISVLSGGERSLTSIALLCAIIASNPAPFVVLDEVDAALDEANSERYAAILKKLSHLTQFITITHNRATMQNANILYGVTMGPDASSKLFSVKLEEV